MYHIDLISSLRGNEKGKNMKYKHEQMSFGEFSSIKSGKKIKLDPSFQVGTDEESRWDKRQQKKYIKSVALRAAPSPFVVVDNQSAFDYNSARGNDDDSIKYFDSLRVDYKYLSIDGNNRSIAIRNFVNDEIGLPHGTYILEDSNLPVRVKKGSDKFSTMNLQLRNQIMDASLLITVYKDVVKSDLPVLFRNINDGIKLNGQQIRQSYPSLIADYVRNKRSEFKKSLRGFFGKKDFIMLKADEWIVKCMAYVVYSGEHKKKDLDNIYMIPKESSSVVQPEGNSRFNVTLNHVLRDIKKGVGDLKKSPNAIFDYFCINYNYSMKNIRIMDRKKFFLLWLDITGDLVGDEKTKYEDDSFDDKDGLTFKTLVRKIGNGYRDYRQKVITDKIEKTAFADGILIQVSDDDYYTLSEKKVMWKRQDGICPCNRDDCTKVIPLEEIGDGSKWHGDAKLPRGKGYLHTLDNGQLMCKIGNQKKSAKLEKFVI